jgi:hypothetical protein
MVRLLRFSNADPTVERSQTDPNLSSKTQLQQSIIESYTKLNLPRGVRLGSNPSEPCTIDVFGIVGGVRAATNTAAEDNAIEGIEHLHPEIDTMLLTPSGAFDNRKILIEISKAADVAVGAGSISDSELRCHTPGTYVE